MIEIKVDTTEFNVLLQGVVTELQDLIPKIGNEIVNYSHKCFEEKKWDGVEWDNKYGEDHLLVGSGNLRRSVRIETYDRTKCVVISDTDYSEIHNEGGRINATEKMVKFFWAKWYETGDENYKWCALKLKSDGYIDIPKRQFLGECNELNELIREFILRQINKTTI